jgi:superfamily I DNA and/or RNA helicase
MAKDHNFREILRAFIKTHQVFAERDFKAKHNPLRPNTIALRAFGDGKRQDLVTQTLNEFGNYFEKVKDGKYFGYIPIYTRIAKDHPEVFPERFKLPTINKSNKEQILEAINDEIEATSSFASQNPVFAMVLEKLEWGIRGKYYYKLALKNEKETEYNLSDNIPVRISWTSSNENLLEGTLVLFDALSETILLELNRSLSEYEKAHTCRILPGTIDLLKALHNRIAIIDKSHRFSNEFMDGGMDFKPIGDRSLNSAGDLDSSQVSAVKHALSNELTFIWGPPGTGKTHTLARLICELLDTGERILVTSISNVATDQIASKVLNDLSSDETVKNSFLQRGKLLRYGYPVLDQIKLESRLFPQKLEMNNLIIELNEFKQQLDKALTSEKKAELASRCNAIQKEIKNITKRFISNAQCVFTTSTQCQIESAFFETEWDTVIIDEGSMVSITHLIALAMHAKRRIVVAGDFKQLGPITLAQSKYAKKWLNEDSFSILQISPENPTHDALKMLTIQRRMHRAIATAISEIFYHGKLKSSEDIRDEDRKHLAPITSSPAVWYRYFGEAEQKGVSRINKGNAMKAIEIASVILSQSNNISIGIITPYRGQVSEIKRLLGELKGSNKVDKAKIKIGTVHAFQGDESDVIIFDTVDTKELAVGKLFHGQAGDRLVNVAISRAKDKIIFIGDLNLFIEGQGSNNTGRFAKLFQDYLVQRSSTHYEEAIENVDSDL